ncbi:hypothetical protein RRG08_059710, partial [Elysia crispata]
RFHTFWAIDHPKTISGDSCVSKGGHGDAAWRNLECSSYCSVICERSTIWRPPPMWKIVVMSITILLLMMVLSCFFFGQRPGRNTVAMVLHYIGRKDVAPRYKMNPVVVLYDSELNELLKFAIQRCFLDRFSFRRLVFCPVGRVVSYLGSDCTLNSWFQFSEEGALQLFMNTGPWDLVAAGRLSVVGSEDQGTSVMDRRLVVRATVVEPSYEEQAVPRRLG